MAVYGLKRATPRMKYVHMNHMVEFKDQLKEHQALEHEVKLCPKCGQPLGHRPLFMVGKYDTCLGCFEQEQLARQIFEANKPYFDNMLEAIGVTYEQDGNVSDLDQTNPAEKAHLLEQAIAEQDRINQEERERRVQQIFPHPNRRAEDNIRLPKAGQYIVSKTWLERNCNSVEDLKPLTNNVKVDNGGTA